MTSLQLELQRLYGLQDDAGTGLVRDDSDVVEFQGLTRSMVLELARPADWAALSAVWAGVQTDLGLPAPAIAVNGKDGFQLWFSLVKPVPVPRAAAFVEALRRRYLGDIAPVRVALRPALEATSARPPLHAAPVPSLQTDSGLWSAFVASDLVPMFVDEPGLDMPPNPDGQAQLLAPLKSIPPVEFERALQQLRPAAVVAPVSNAAAKAAGALEPRQFLLDVMNNESLDMALRIEAAKALLPHAN